MNQTEIKLETLAQLYPAVVADILDELGYREQCLPDHIRPLTPSKRIAGQVLTARAETVDAIPESPYKLEIEAVERLGEGEVLLVDCGDDRTCGFWGELLTTACLYKKSGGVVMTACTRDMWKIRELDFPVFGIGYHPADSKGRADIVELGDPIEIGGVRAKTGDYILGDEDGLVVIPQEVAAETVRRALEKVSGENVVREELANGMPMGEAFARYGIL
ncbi:MAG: RraA family protein [Puniceicoccales bacterium]